MKNINLIKKVLFSLIFVVFITFFGKGQGLSGAFINIPDYYFLQALIDAGIDKDGNNKIDTIEASNIKKIMISTSGARNLIGIEYFKNIDSLNCSINNIDSLDLSKNILLKYLNCSHNQINHLDLSKNISLLYLDCSQNKIVSLDLSKNVLINGLDCSYNQIDSFDLSENNNLEYLDCHFNYLSQLDLTKNVKLYSLNCSANRILSLNIDGCKNLHFINAGGNKLDFLDASNCCFDTTAQLIVSNNYLRNIKLNNYFEQLDLRNNNLDSLNLLNFPYLFFLEIYLNPLKVIKFSNMKNLFFIDATFWSYDFSNFTSLTTLTIDNCDRAKCVALSETKNIKKLTLTNNKNLKEVCVWTAPFPPSGLILDTTASPKVYFDTICQERINAGVKNIEKEKSFSVYPNPATNELKVDKVYKVESFRIMNIVGQIEMLKQVQHDGISTGSMTVDVSGLSRGIYIIELTTKEGVVRSKFIKE